MTEDDVIATEDSTNEKLVNCGPVEEMEASRSDDNEGPVKPLVSAGMAVTLFDSLRSTVTKRFYSIGHVRGCN